MPRVVLTLRRRSREWSYRTILHPQGQFSQGALGLKTLKKRSYLLGARALGLHRGIEWQATSAAEADEIRTTISPNAVIHVAPDMHKPLCTEMRPIAEPKKSVTAAALLIAGHGDQEPALPLEPAPAGIRTNRPHHRRARRRRSLLGEVPECDFAASESGTSSPRGRTPARADTRIPDGSRPLRVADAQREFLPCRGRGASGWRSDAD